MPYCRKCGAKLDDDARFCRVCGIPVITYEETVPSAYTYEQQKRRPVSWVLGGTLIAILVAAGVIAGLAFVPVQNVNFNQGNIVPTAAGINNVYLDLNADAVDINVFTTSFPGELVRVNVSATGARGLFESANEPAKITFDSYNTNSTTVVSCHITRQQTWPSSYGVKVTCNVYLNPSATLNVHVSTSVGKVSLDANQSVNFQALNLQSNTGAVSATVSGNASFSGPISVTTTTGTVTFTWNNCRLSANNTLSLGTITGEVHANITQTQPLGANLTMSATTTTGTANLNMNLSGPNAAQITSHTTIGHISTNVQNFNGNQSPLHSNNYPAANNIVANLSTTTGSININAAHQGPPSGNPF